MGSSQSSPLQNGITAALNGDEKLYAFPSKFGYQIEDVRPYNLTIPIKPAAVTYPKTASQVAAIVRVAAENGLKVGPHYLIRFDVSLTKNRYNRDAGDTAMPTIVRVP